MKARGEHQGGRPERDERGDTGRVHDTCEHRARGDETADLQQREQQRHVLQRREQERIKRLRIGRGHDSVARHGGEPVPRAQRVGDAAVLPALAPVGGERGEQESRDCDALHASILFALRGGTGVGR
jgi:hypothetical protein